MADQVSLTIDGVKVTVPKGTLLVEAAKKAQTAEIPVYCYHEKLGPAGLCRVCLVDIEGMPKLQIACWTQATEGMVVHTINERASEGRRAILEMFLLNHPLDCPICDKGGECSLQDFAVAYGQDASRSAEPKESKPKAVDLGPTIVLDEERCIVCQRCVRFEQIISHEHGLVVKDRGSHDVIATAAGGSYESDFTGNVTELCPVGALTSKTYRFKARPWDNHRAQSSCAQCAVGCSLSVDVRHGAISRTMSDGEDPVSDGWLCDRGRYAIGFIADEQRLRMPLLRQNGEVTQIAWDDALAMWAKALRETSNKRIAAIGGGRLTNEENYLYQHIMRVVGTPHLDWRTGRQYQAAVGRDAGTLAELEHASAIIVAGVPPAQNAPVLDLRIRKAVTVNHAKLLSVGPLGAGSHVPETRCAKFSDALDALPQNPALVALVWDGADLAAGRELEAFAQELTRRGVAVRRYLAGDVPNGRGAEAMGMHPNFGPGYEPIAHGGMDFTAIMHAAARGDIGVLSILGADPLLTAGDGAAVRAALARVPFIVVSELFQTPTTEFATLILPAASAYERSGHFLNLTGTLRPLRTAIAPPDGILSDAEILIGLADVLEIPLPSKEETASFTAAPVAAERMNHFGFADERLAGTQAPAPAAEADLRVVTGRAIFAGSGTLAHDARIAHLRSKPTAVVSPATALRYELGAGTVIDLRAGDRILRDLLVKIDARLSDGWIEILDGLAEAPANLVRDGEAVVIEHIRGARPLVGAGT